VANLTELRLAALEIFRAGLKGVDARAAVRRAVRLEGSSLHLAETSFELSASGAGVYVIALGKAAFSMALALEDVLGPTVRAGLAVGPRLDPAHLSTTAPEFSSFTRTRWRLMEGGHPLPDAGSLRAAQVAFELLDRAEAERAPVIFLISGGGSAMIEWPRDERITLDDLREANRVLVSCGAAIAEINAVRRAFSAIKGGALAARAPHAPQVSLIVSDTGEGQEAEVASGPTIEPPVDRRAASFDARSIVARYHLAARLPESILRAIDSAERGKASAPGDAARAHYVLLDNRRAMEAAAEEALGRGCAVEIARDIVEQPVAEGCREMIERLLALHRSAGAGERGLVCLVSGGEFACPVRGKGTGGRNSETALRCAIELDERYAVERSRALELLPAEIVALSAGTDGIDGNSPAAGALAESNTIERARALGLNAQSFLDASDAYSFFEALGDTIMTGPTGTNVRDLRILLARSGANVFSSSRTI
jgi:glycerate 2-kinase